jgi:hypothetical protein
MTYKDMQKVVRRQLKQVLKIRDAGQKEYARTEDNVFANFERVSSFTGVSREQALMTYLLKHIDGIMAHINGHKSQREDVSGRITDAIVYLLLLQGMVDDGKSK